MFQSYSTGLDNIALVIQRRGIHETQPVLPKSLLIASHYDSAVCSYGERMILSDTSSDLLIWESSPPLSWISI
jgi:hypothetical protein